MKNIQIFEQINADKDLFATIIKNKDSITWNEIINIFHEYSNTNLGTYFSKFFIVEKDLERLEKFGIDYNFKDQMGNNFLHYVLSNKGKYHLSNSDYNSSRGNDYYMFENAVIEKIFEKTNNIYEKNNAGEQIIVYYLQHHFYSVEIEEIWKLVEKYPDFDYKVLNNRGQNLIYSCVLYNCNYQVVDFLINKGVDLYIEDKDNQNLLHMFFMANFNKDYKNLYNNLINNLDITKQSKYGKNCLTTWLEFICHGNTSDSSKKRSVNWLNHTFEQIKDGKFYYNLEILETLHSDLLTYKDEYLESLYSIKSVESDRSMLLFNEALITLHKKILEFKIVAPETTEESHSNYRKSKVKI